MFTSILHGKTQLIISATVDELDLAPYVKNGRLDLYLRVIGGVRVGKLHSSVAITDPGSQVYIKNDGAIWGENGAGASAEGYSWESAYTVAPAKGETAIVLAAKLTIDNTNGDIFGGGGGGGVGGEFVFGPGGTVCGGGGYPGGHSKSFEGLVVYDASSALYGAASGGYYSHPTYRGGACNGAGQAGEDGVANVPATGNMVGASVGDAIDADGIPVTWVGGFNSTQVKGSVV